METNVSIVVGYCKRAERFPRTDVPNFQLLPENCRAREKYLKTIPYALCQRAINSSPFVSVVAYFRLRLNTVSAFVDS